MTEADERVVDHFPHEAWCNTEGGLPCDCPTGRIIDFVRDERALVLDEVAAVAYTASANKPPRVVRVMRQSAELIRRGEF